MTSHRPFVRPALAATGVAALLVACGARTGLGTLGDTGPADATSGSDASDANTSDVVRFDAADAADARDTPPDVAPPLCPIPLDATVSAVVRITTDDDYILWIDGVLVDDTPRLWTSPQTYTVSIFRHPSRRNAIAIQGTNRQNTSGPDRGIVMDMRFTAGSSEARVVTDASWRLSSTLVPGWNTLGFDASAWGPAFVEGPYGMAPWGNVFATPSTARWLWSFDSNLPANQKVVTQTVWIHRDFWIDVAGNVRDGPTPCP